ncbi:MAG: lysozyme [Pseudomonadota bacterium]
MLKFILDLFWGSKSTDTPTPPPTEAPKPTTERLPGESTGAWMDRVMASDARPADVGEFLAEAVKAEEPTSVPLPPKVSRRNINAAGLALIKTGEGCVLYPYDDLRAPVKGKYVEWKGEKLIGTPTIGYGHTDAAKHPLKVKPGIRITEAEATAILDTDLDECEDAVSRLVKVPLNDNQFGALVSFQFNLGALGSSTLLKKLNAGDYSAVPGEMRRWVNAGGKRLQGLVNRREAEITLWNTP